METVLTILNCGHNCSGFSACVTVQQVTRCGERKAVAICLINAGDSVLKFCNENRIKLKLVKCVFVTSLVPHNISGLPGLILSLSSLGLESLSIIAPPGVKGLLDVMIPFTNRRYPHLDVHEITQLNKKVLICSIPHFHFNITAVCHSTHSTNVIALAGSITSSSSDAEASRSVACIPYSQTYQISPSVSKLCSDFSKIDRIRLVIFIPLQSGGGVLASTHVTTSLRPPPPPIPEKLGAFSEDQLCKFFNELCKRHILVGIFVGLTRTTKSIEFRQSQINLHEQSRFNGAISIPVFPTVEAKMNDRTNIKSEDGVFRSSLSWCSNLSSVWNQIKLQTLMTGDQVVSACPLLSVNMDVNIDNDISARNSDENKFQKKSSRAFQESNINRNEGNCDNSETDSNVSSSIGECDNIEGSKSDNGKYCNEDSDEASDEDSDEESDEDSDDEDSDDEDSDDEDSDDEDSDDEDSDDEDSGHSDESDGGVKVDMTMFAVNSAAIQDQVGQLAAICQSRNEEIEKFLNLKTIRLSKSCSFQDNNTDCILRDNTRRIKRKRPEDREDDSYDGGIMTSFPPPSPVNSMLTFLGTGCAVPSKHRSSSCIVYQLSLPFCSQQSIAYGRSKRVSIIIDAGESCLSQLYQSYSGNLSLVHEMLRSTAVIWISHHHADHHCGLPLLLEEIQRIQISDGCNTKFQKIIVVAPKSVLSYQEYFACISGYDDIVEFVDIHQTRSTLSFRKFDEFTRKITHHTKNMITKLESIPVNHCKDSYGLVLHCSNGEKIVYSGDCRPSDSLISAGKSCDLLIHEATFDDSLHEDAVMKKHSTVSEALSVGSAMNAKYVVLTHFSQRYAKSISRNDCSYSYSNYIMAYDFLRFSFPSQIEPLQRYLLCAESLLEEMTTEKNIENGGELNTENDDEVNSFIL